MCKGLVFFLALGWAAHVYLNPEPDKVECQFYISNENKPLVVRTRASFINASDVLYEISDPLDEVMHVEQVTMDSPIVFVLH